MLRALASLPRCGAPWRGLASRSAAARHFAAAPGAAQVKSLRDRTGASMGKCRQALLEQDGDVERAVEWLRERGIKSAEKRTAEAGEALLAMRVDGSAGAVVELRAETDFVTRSELFQNLAASVARTAAAHPGAASIGEESLCPVEGFTQVSGGATVETALLEMSSVLGERIVLHSSCALAAPGADSLVAGYVHPKHPDGAAFGTGKLAALVALRGAGLGAEGEDVARQLAKHVVAAQPAFVSVAAVPSETIEKERELCRVAFVHEKGEKAAGNEAVLKKVLDGKLEKFYQEKVLLKQEFVAPGVEPTPVSKWLEAQAAALGVGEIVVHDFRLAHLS